MLAQLTLHDIMLCLILSSNKGTPHLMKGEQAEGVITSRFRHATHIEVAQSSEHTLIKTGLHNSVRVTLSARRDVCTLRGGQAVAPTGRCRGGRFSHKIDFST
jgi:hypothetical protein